MKLSLLLLIFLFCLFSYSVVFSENRIVPSQYPSIQEAIQASYDGDVILVENGEHNALGSVSYQGWVGIDFCGKSIVVRSLNGPSNCILNPNRGRSVYFHGFETKAAVLSGFTIKCGNVDLGGGIYLEDSSPTIENCIIERNVAIQGAGVFCINGSPFVKDCIIRNNTAEGGYGGVLVSGSNAVFLNCEIKGNSADYYSAGIGIGDDSKITIYNCLIASNRATIDDQAGCGIRGQNAEIYLANSTIVKNTSASGLGNGIRLVNSAIEIINSIFWENVDQSGVGLFYDSDCTASYSLISYSGDSNFVSNPLFIGDYCLSQIQSGQDYNSPCVDSGKTASEATCFDSFEQVQCFSSMTTSQNSVPDQETCDLGFHRYSEYCPTPTPSPTQQPTQSSNFGVQLEMPSHSFRHPDVCWLKAVVVNKKRDIVGFPLFVILECGGVYWFWDEWTTAVDYKVMDFPVNPHLEITVIEEFIWPFSINTSPITAHFYGAILTPDMNDIVGDLGSWDFNFY